MNATDTATTLRIERTFVARAGDVFDAWTNPEVLRRWWATRPSMSTPIADVDLRVGGTYRLAMQDADGGPPHTVRGEYLEVRRPELLRYTWAWENEDGSVGHESTVSVHFLSEQEGTRVVLEHYGLPSADSREKHGEGWTGCLESLQRLYEHGPMSA